MPAAASDVCGAAGERMTIEQFTASLTLWHDARGDWNEAHRLAQDVDDRDGAWVHAYLHRKEGDPGNAGYWYRRAGQAPASDSLQDEWTRIAAALLART
jgi:hypothetical protein